MGKHQENLVLRNTKQGVSLFQMNSFGSTIRSLRQAQNLGLRETAVKIGISPTYLSRIEREKERPPRPEVIKQIAKILAADPDVLFRKASTTDPELEAFIAANPEVLALVRFLMTTKPSTEEILRLHEMFKVGSGSKGGVGKGILG